MRLLLSVIITLTHSSLPGVGHFCYDLKLGGVLADFMFF